MIKWPSFWHYSQTLVLLDRPSLNPNEGLHLHIYTHKMMLFGCPSLNPNEGLHFHIYIHKMICLYGRPIDEHSGRYGSRGGRGKPRCSSHQGHDGLFVCFTNKPSVPDEKSTFAFVYMDCESVWKLLKLKKYLLLPVFSNSLSLDNFIQCEDAAISNLRSICSCGYWVFSIFFLQD